MMILLALKKGKKVLKIGGKEQKDALDGGKSNRPKGGVIASHQRQSQETCMDDGASQRGRVGRGVSAWVGTHSFREPIVDLGGIL